MSGFAVKAAAEKEDVKADMDVADICAALEKGMTEIFYGFILFKYR